MCSVDVGLVYLQCSIVSLREEDWSAGDERSTVISLTVDFDACHVTLFGQSLLHGLGVIKNVILES